MEDNNEFHESIEVVDIPKPSKLKGLLIILIVLIILSGLVALIYKTEPEPYVTKDISEMSCEEINQEIEIEKTNMFARDYVQKLYLLKEIKGCD